MTQGTIFDYIIEKFHSETSHFACHQVKIGFLYNLVRWPMMRLLITVALAVVLGGCTMLYTREYVAEVPQRMSTAETEQVFRAFRDFLVFKGLSPQHYGDKVETDRVTFRIGGSNAGFALRRDWEDLLELSYSGDNGFRLRLIRIVHHPADFSDEYLKQFVEKTEGFLREATNKPIRLTLVPRKGT